MTPFNSNEETTGFGRFPSFCRSIYDTFPATRILYALSSLSYTWINFNCTIFI